MAISCESLKFNPGERSATIHRYQEFTVEDDGKMLAGAFIAEYGSKEAAIEEMLYMTIVAAAKDDITSINAMACVRKYWRSSGPQMAPAKETTQSL